jgi:hypothetical protein
LIVYSVTRFRETRWQHTNARDEYELNPKPN